MFVAWLEQVGVDAALPAHDVAKATLLEFGLHGGRTDHAMCGSTMKTAQDRIRKRQRNWQSAAQIFRKLRVIRRGEVKVVCGAIAPHRKAYRTFGGDMNRVRRKRLDMVADRCPWQQREADLWVAWASHSAKLLRREQ